MKYNGHYALNEIVYTKSGTTPSIDSYVSENRFVITDMHLLVRDYPNLDSSRLTKIIKQITEICYEHTLTHPGVARLAPKPIECNIVLPMGTEPCVLLHQESFILNEQNITDAFIDLSRCVSAPHVSQTLLHTKDQIYTHMAAFSLTTDDRGDFRRIIWKGCPLEESLSISDIVDVWYKSVI